MADDFFQQEQKMALLETLSRMNDQVADILPGVPPQHRHGANRSIPAYRGPGVRRGPLL